MATSNFATENKSFRSLLGNGDRYEVPTFQRDYAWDDEQWEDLWLDTLAVVEGKEPDHYLGYLVLHQADDRTYRIIDGQQRLVTISLLVLAACRKLDELVGSGQDEEDNKKRLEQLRRTYIGDFDAVTLAWRTKLTLNRNNDHVFNDYLVELKPTPRRGVRYSSRRLGRGLDWFSARIARRCSNGPDLARFVDAMARGLFFTVIYVPDELKAYRVFETLNARGVQLSSADLLKNRLFALVHEQKPAQLGRMERRWRELVDRIRERQLVPFLRDHWLSRGRFVRKRDLFRAIQSDVQDAGKAFELVRGLEVDVDPWTNLHDPAGATEWSREIRRAASILRILQVRQPFALLLAAHRRGQVFFGKVLRAVIVISVRYNLIGRQPPSEQEEVYASASARLESGELKTVAQVVDALRPIYPDDERFRTAFATKRFRLHSRNKKSVRYLLHALELEAWDAGSVDLSSADPTIEHLLPESPGEAWAHIDDLTHENMVDRLGNLALLEATLNRDVGNVGWTKKRAVLAKSGLRTTSVVATRYETWTADEIDARQEQMARRAVHVWRL